jgi:hypothetical protein
MSIFFLKEKIHGSFSPCNAKVKYLESLDISNFDTTKEAKIYRNDIASDRLKNHIQEVTSAEQQSYKKKGQVPLNFLDKMS